MQPIPSLQRRVLGVLVEKALTAAAPEPLTLNAIVVGSNQKSNRDPIMEVEEPEVDTALEWLQREGLVFRIVGGRAERWRHNVYEAWKVSKAEAALLAELMLRGPQTAAEARARASRMASIDSEQYPETLRSLVERKMVVWLTPENRRGAILTHGFHDAAEMNRATAFFTTGAGAVIADSTPTAPSPATPAVKAPVVDGRLDQALAEIAALREEVATLRQGLADLRRELGVG